MELKDLKFDPLGDGISTLQYIDHMGSDFGIVESARVSRTDPSEVFWRGEEDIKLLKYMLKHGHTSPFEQNSIKLYVVAPMPIAVQWLCHRMASYNMLSRRYTSEDIEFYIPKVWRLQNTTGNKQGSFNQPVGCLEDTADMYEYSLTAAKQNFELMTESTGIANEQARFILPQGLYTKFYVTANLHSWMHFYDLREDEHAQREIRVYAEALSSIMWNLFPHSWSIFTKLRKERKFKEKMFEVEWDEQAGKYFVHNKLDNSSTWIKEEVYEGVK